MPPLPLQNNDLKIASILHDKIGSYTENGIHFFDYMATSIIPGYFNIGYIRDIPHLQLMDAKHPDKMYIMSVLNNHTTLIKKLDGFITMTSIFANTIKTTYDINIPYELFQNFPSWHESPLEKRNEIVYIGAPIEKEHIPFMAELKEKTKLETLSHFYVKMRRSRGIIVNYDYGSKYGIIINTHNINQAKEGLARKLLSYLSSGIYPIIHSSFISMINFCRENKIEPIIYTTIDDITPQLSSHNYSPIIRENFCIETRIGSLKEKLKNVYEMAHQKTPIKETPITIQTPIIIQPPSPSQEISIIQPIETIISPSIPTIEPPQQTSKEMKILFIGKNDWAGVANNLTEAINIHTPHKARCVTINPPPFNHKYDLLVSNKNKKLIKELIETSDVIIFISSYYNFLPFTNHIKPNAVIGIWHGGTEYRTKYEYYNTQIHPKVDIIFAHRDLETLDSHTFRLQAPFNTDFYIPIEKNMDQITIGHSPSVRKNKGTSMFLEAARYIHEKYPLRTKILLLENMTNDEIIKEKQNIHILFDQMGGYKIPKNATPGYGLSLVESASFGSVCMSWSNYPDTPLITTRNIQELIDKIDHLIKNPEKITNIEQKTREWVIQEHGYKAVATKFISDLLSLPKAKTFGCIPIL